MPTAVEETITAPSEPEHTRDDSQNQGPPPEGERERRGAGRRQAKTDSTEPEKTDFWNVILGLNEPDWEDHIVYLYRWQPFYDQTQGGVEKKYVKLYNGRFTIDDIKRDCGSGKYNLKLNKSSSNTNGKRTDKTIKEVVFDILDQQYPPKLPPGDWQKDPRNKKWVWETEAPAAQPQRSNEGLTAANIREVRSLVNELAPQGRQSDVTAELVKVLPALLEQKNQGGQQLTMGDVLQVVTAIVAAMKPPPPPPPPPPDTTVVTILTSMLTAAEKRAEAMEARFMTLLTQREERAQPVSMIDQAKQLGETVAAFSSAAEAIGGGRGGSPSWVEGVTAIGTEIAKHVGPVLPMMFAPRPQSPQQPRVINTRPQPMPVPPQPGQPGQPAQQQPQQPPPPQQQPPPASETVIESEPAPSAPPENSHMLIQALMMVSTPLLQQLNAGETGLDFAWWVYDGYGAMPITFLKGIGKEGILAQIEAEGRNPQSPLRGFYEQVRPQWAEFDQFIDAFLTWTPSMVREGEGDDTEPPAAEPAPPTKGAAAKPTAPKSKKVKK